MKNIIYSRESLGSQFDRTTSAGPTSPMCFLADLRRSVQLVATAEREQEQQLPAILEKKKRKANRTWNPGTELKVLKAAAQRDGCA